jgi:hypothetical protein
VIPVIIEPEAHVSCSPFAIVNIELRKDLANNIRPRAGARRRSKEALNMCRKNRMFIIRGRRPWPANARHASPINALVLASLLQMTSEFVRRYVHVIVQLFEEIEICDGCEGVKKQWPLKYSQNVGRVSERLLYRLLADKVFIICRMPSTAQQPRDSSGRT